MGFIQEQIDEYRYDMTPHQRRVFLGASLGALTFLGAFGYISANIKLDQGPDCSPSEKVPTTYTIVVEEGEGLWQAIGPEDRPSHMPKEDAVYEFEQQNGIEKPGDIFPNQGLEAVMLECPPK